MTRSNIGYLVQTFEIMARSTDQPSPIGVQRYVALSRDKIDKLVKDAPARLYFPFIVALLPTDYSTVPRQIQSMSPQTSIVPYCLRGPEEWTYIRGELVHDGQDTKDRVVGRRSWFRGETQLRRIQYTITRSTGFGGRSMYEVKRDDAGLTWVQDTWTRTKREISWRSGGSGEVIVESEPQSKLERCDALINAIGGAPEVYNEFQVFLSLYDAHVATESWLLALQATARQSIGVCGALEAELKAK